LERYIEGLSEASIPHGDVGEYNVLESKALNILQKV
jgi:hypothetical protein